MTIERGVAAQEMEQDATGVDVSLAKQADGSVERVRFAYVVGCDGSHSVVRHAAGLSFDGASYPQKFILCDVHLSWSELAVHRIHMFLGSPGVMALFPFEDGTARIISALPASENSPDPTLEEFRDLFKRFAPGTAQLDDPLWLAQFNLHHRGVENYRKVHVFA